MKVVCDNGLSDGQIELIVFPNKKIVQFEFEFNHIKGIG
jgi:hypothetical protein